MLKKLDQSVNYLKRKIKTSPAIGLILGSGWNEIITNQWFRKRIILSYHQIPHFPSCTVAGHQGQLILAEVDHQPVVILQGRYHYYEGYSMEEVSYPVRVLGRLGINKLIVTNAAGSVSALRPGNLMLITDHINFSIPNPLLGKNIESLGPRYPDMCYAYDLDLLKVAEEVGQQLKIKLKKGVYLGTSGPNYETPAEIKMMRKIGADAVGMSTVPETLTAVHMGIKVLGLSLITNQAPSSVSHQAILKLCRKLTPKLSRLVISIIRKI